MSTFDLKKIESIKGKYPFYQLTIDDNVEFSNLKEGETANDRKTGVLDLYEQQLQKKYKKDLIMIYAYMERVANNCHVDGRKYHILERPDNDPHVDFEFKHGDLRVYGIKSQEGKIIVLGGYKNEQETNIKKLRSLKKQFLESQTKSKK
jgi:hypothetical protein